MDEHVVESDAERDRALGQWDTPEREAEVMVDLCGEMLGSMAGASILEPSCGRGAIVRELVARGARVHALEIDEGRCAGLRAEGVARVDAPVDFLAMAAPEWKFSYDAVVMNPPFERGRAAAHIAHALLFAPIVVALAPASIFYGRRNASALWDRGAGRRLTEICHFVRRPSFAGAGGRLDCSILGFSEDRPWNGPTVTWIYP